MGRLATLNAPVPGVAPSAGTITPEIASTLPGLFRERTRRTPTATAYRYFDPASCAWRNCSWQDMAKAVASWQAALEKEALPPGSRVAIMLHNSIAWVLAHQAALGLGLMVVPLYVTDRADNVEYVLRDAGATLLVIDGADAWSSIKSRADDFDSVSRIVAVSEIHNARDNRLINLKDWLPRESGPFRLAELRPDDPALIVYTSGTTGHPKGVMLSHRNILSNAWGGLRSIPVTERDVFLSFLPLSHMLEFTTGYILPMMAGATVAYARGIAGLAEDLIAIRPTLLICVPRVFERIHARIMERLAGRSGLTGRLFSLAVATGWRCHEYTQRRGSWHATFLLWPLLKWLVGRGFKAQFGGRLRAAISGGAMLPARVARVFIGLGIPVLQGYGLTETSPVVSVNRVDNNIPESIGMPLPGVQVLLAADNELLVKGDLVMLGYWNNAHATRAVLDEQGWLRTGDQARIEGQHIFITGRLKEIIVLSNGEKLPPADMEIAILSDDLFEQAMVIGEARPYLTALVMLNQAQWLRVAAGGHGMSEREIEAALLQRIAAGLKTFPGYAKVRRVTRIDEPWSVENGLLTPTLKARRNAILNRYAAEIERMYVGHT